jgi:cytochrome c oxidase subunit 2
MDLVPGMVTYFWVNPSRAGTLDLLCNELCGVAHYAMRGKVVVEEEGAFQAWLGGHPTFAQTMAIPPGDAGAGKQAFATCAACHGAQGEGNPAMNAPKLTGLGDWYLQRQLKYFKQGIRGTHERDVHGKTMAAMAATLADATAIANVSAFIGTLPVKSAPTTVNGDPGGGRRLYESTCSTCHGPDGRGVQATNAPALKGMNDWYLVTQLNNFRQGIRGSHPQDVYGSQMALMSATVGGEQAIKDLVAYINSLP